MHLPSQYIARYHRHFQYQLSLDLQKPPGQVVGWQTPAPVKTSAVVT
jgi:hypothetical protein